MDYQQLQPRNDGVKDRQKYRLIFLIIFVAAICFNYWIVWLLFR